MVLKTPTTENDILQQLVYPIDENDPEAARALLRIKFDGAVIKRVNQLLRKNSRGKITADERILLDKYLRMGTFLDIIQAKARKVLKKAGHAE